MSAKDGRAYIVDDPGFADVAASSCYVDLTAAAADSHPEVELVAPAPATPSPSPTPAPTPEVFAVIGTLTAFHTKCDTIDNGQNVVAYNENGAVIGATTTTNYHEIPGRFVASITDCQVSFSLYVPRAQFYRFKVGSHDGPTYSFAQLQQMNGRVAHSLD